MSANNEEPKIIGNLTDEQVELLQSHASIVGNNYFLPFWFKRIEGNKFELIPLGKLPYGMSLEIDEMRKQIARDSMFDDNAYFKK